MKRTLATAIFVVLSAACSTSATARLGQQPGAVPSDEAWRSSAGRKQAPSAAAGAAELAQALTERLVTPDGGVFSYYRDDRQEDPDVAGVGHERLSESSGLLLTHAVASGDSELSRRAAGYYRARLRASVGLAHWKLDRADNPVPSRDGSFSSAPVDEFRLATTLSWLAMGTADRSYQDDADRLGRSLVAALTYGLPADDVSWGQHPPTPSRRVEVDYLDVAAMRRLGRVQPEWGEVADRSLSILQGARSVDDGPPRQFYDPPRRQYFCDGPCGTVAGLYTGLHLDQAGDKPAARSIYRYYTTRIQRDGVLSTGYTPSGQPADGGQDLACYALLARLASRLGDEHGARGLIDHWVSPRRITTGPLAGLYSLVADDASSFVNLTILLTLDEMEGRPVPAD